MIQDLGQITVVSLNFVARLNTFEVPQNRLPGEWPVLHHEHVRSAMRNEFFALALRKQTASDQCPVVRALH